MRIFLHTLVPNFDDFGDFFRYYFILVMFYLVYGNNKEVSF